MSKNRKIYRENFPAGTVQKWKAKEYAWGIGYVPLGKYVTLRNEKPVALRLQILNPEEYTPKAGEIWLVTPVAWTLPGKTDKEDRAIAVVEGTLKEKFVEVKKTFDRKRHEAPVKIYHERERVPAKKVVENVVTDILPFRDPADPTRVLFMEATLVDGKIAKKKLQRVGTLDNYLTARADNLRALIEGGLENPYKGSRNTKGIIEKYCKVPLEEIVDVPPFLS